MRSASPILSSSLCGWKVGSKVSQWNPLFTTTDQIVSHLILWFLAGREKYFKFNRTIITVNHCRQSHTIKDLFLVAPCWSLCCGKPRSRFKPSNLSRRYIVDSGVCAEWRYSKAIVFRLLSSIPIRVNQLEQRSISVKLKPERHHHSVMWCEHQYFFS